MACQEGTFRFLKGTIYDDLLPLLASQRLRSEVVELLQARYGAHKVSRTLGSLVSSGILREDDFELNNRVASYWQMLGMAKGVSGKSAASVEVISMNANRLRAASEAFLSLGIAVRAKANFRLVIAEDYLDPALEKLNREAIYDKRPWMVVRPCGREHWLGPLFIPGRTACWNCLALRLRENVWGASGTAALAAGSMATEVMAAIESAKWLFTARNPAVVGKLRAFDTVTLESRLHDVTRFPQCDACAGMRRPRWNRNTPEVRFKHHSSNLTGVFSKPVRLQTIAGVYIYMAQLNQTLRPAPDGTFGFADRLVALGKDVDRDSALMACVAEAIERYSIQFHGDEPRTTATLNSLGPQGISPERLLLRSKEHQGSEHFYSGLPTEWVSGRSLASKIEYFLPAAYCYVDYVVPWCHANSNGCAAGITFTEATLRGFLELVERDAFAIWWYNRARRPAIDLGRCGSWQVKRLLELFERAGRRVHVLDATSDFGIPVMIAVTPLPDGSDILIGSAAAFDVEQAAVRALLEAAVLLGQIVSSPISKTRVSSAFDWWRQTARLADHPYLKPQGQRQISRTAPPGGSPDRQLAWCVARAKRLGLDVIAVDLTRPEVGVPVARVIVPGMRHWGPAFAPGRLYDVPVDLGWRKTRNGRKDLNATNFFF